MRFKLVHSPQSIVHRKLWTRKGFTPLETIEQPKKRKVSLTGFTYIEVLITLAIVAVLFIPMMQLFSHGLYSATVSGDLITAVNLARWEMERVKNLNITKDQMKRQGDVWTPSLDEPPLEVNKLKWRILRRLKSESDTLEVNVEVFSAGNLNKPIASLVTLIEDSIWIN